MRKLYYVTTFIIVLIVSFLGITYSMEYNTENELKFELIGPNDLYLDVNTEYIEYGIKVVYNKIDVSQNVIIDTSSIDMSKIGEYKVKYEYNNEYIYRNVIVIDKSGPTIELIGGNEITILLNGNYYEPGYYITDNYDKDLTDKVIITGTVDTKKEGIYELTYSVTDNNGNLKTATRTVIVKKIEVTEKEEQPNKIIEGTYDATLYTNTIINNHFNSDGIYFEGYVKKVGNQYQLKLKKRNSDLVYTYNMNSYKEHYYNGNIRLTSLENGTYDIYLIAKDEEKLINKEYVLNKIVRAKIGNKLVTVKYDNDYVSIKIEDFEYQYDIVIDSGYSSNSNGIITESDLNQKISNYEKCRYESMGYHVYMTINDNNLKIEDIEKRAAAVGYYGVVSKVVYSNNHNLSKNTNNNGFEIITANQVSSESLSREISILSKYKELTKNKTKIYSKNYNTKETYDKNNGKTYQYNNYHPVIRIPYQLFNVQNIIYEPIYMSNPNEFNWYYTGNNWIKVSEIKIEEYVKYMGGVYNSDNQSCL